MEESTRVGKKRHCQLNINDRLDEPEKKTWEMAWIISLADDKRKQKKKNRNVYKKTQRQHEIHSK